MKIYALLLISIIASTTVVAQHADMEMKPAAEKPATIVAGMSSTHHPVSTTEPEAQKFFDQGLAFVYAFNHEEAVRSFKRAAEIKLAYDEPPAWFLSTRQLLGEALFESGDPAGAEQVFRADLERNRRSGRSLFGLMLSLRAQQKSYAAAMVQREFENAWKYADTTLTVESLWP